MGESAVSEESSAAPVIGAAGRNAARWAVRLQRRPASEIGARQSLPSARPAPPGVIQRAPAAREEGDEEGGDRETAATGHRRQESEALGQDEAQERPELIFFQPPPEPGGESGKPPSGTATETGGGGAGAGQTGPKKPPAPQQADARAVADRVYELMMQEVVLARLRGGANLGGRR